MKRVTGIMLILSLLLTLPLIGVTDVFARLVEMDDSATSGRFESSLDKETMSTIDSNLDYLTQLEIQYENATDDTTRLEIEKLYLAEVERIKKELEEETNLDDESINLIAGEDKKVGTRSDVPKVNVRRPQEPLRYDFTNLDEWSNEEILDYLQSIYPEVEDAFPQYLVSGKTKLELNYDTLRNYGVIAWGTPQDVEKFTEFKNSSVDVKNKDGKTEEQYRFWGLSRDISTPVNNINYPQEAYSSSTELVYARNFIYEPWDKAGSIQNSHIKPSEKSYWMDSDFKEDRETNWIPNLSDKYFDYYYKELKEYSPWRVKSDRGEEISNWAKMGQDKLNRVIYVETPPTHISLGMATEWHGANGRYYDSFYIDKLKFEYDLSLDKLQLTEDGRMIADVTYVGLYDLKEGHPVKFNGLLEYKGAINGVKNITFDYYGGFNPIKTSRDAGGEIAIYQTRVISEPINNFPKAANGTVDYTLKLEVNSDVYKFDETNLANNSNMALLSLNNGALVPTSEDTVPEWRLSKYWNNLSPTPTSANYRLSVSSGNDGYSLNSGSAIFNAVSPNLSSTPWAFSTARILDGKNSAYFSTGNLSSSFFVGGDLLAVKANNSVDNIKLANWVKSNPANLQGVISSTNKGSSSTTSLVEKNHIFNYDVSTSKSFTYYKDYWGTDKDGKVYYYSTGPHTAGKNSIPASYDKTIKFNRFLPASSTTASTFSSTKDTNTNGMYWETGTSSTSLKVNPEVFMAYSDTTGATKGAFVAGDYLREIKPVYYNSAKFTNVNVKPSVTGTSTATDSRARTLASSLGAGGNAVIYKGSAIASSYVVDGQIELKTYALDVGDSALKNAWGNAGYSTDAINNDFLSKYATKNASTGKWEVTLDTTGRMKINGAEYGGTSNKLKATQTSQKVNTYNLVIRGGKLVSVNGNSNLNSLSQELKDALQRMNISTSNNVFSSFESGKGVSLDEANVATVGNSLRGTSDLAVGKGWYNEDTTSLVVKEYVNTFKLPSYMSVDKIPMQIPGLEAPINKNLFFSKGYTGYTTLKMQVNDAWMKFDSSINGFGGNRSINYVVPNVSVLDTFY